MDFDYQTLINWIGYYLWPIFRMSGLFMTLPVLNSEMLPKKIRLVILLLVTFAVAQVKVELPPLNLLSFAAFYFIVQELLIGILMGLIFQFVLQAFVIGGQVIAMQMGLGFATLVDPSSKANVPLVSQFYLMMVTLIFLSLDGHLQLINLAAQSYQQGSIFDKQVDANLISSILLFSAWMFKGAVLTALPAIISLLVVNVMFGVMTRAAPQFNIFSIGFAITLLLGIIIIYFTAYNVIPQFINLFEHGLELARKVA